MTLCDLLLLWNKNAFNFAQLNHCFSYYTVQHYIYTIEQTGHDLNREYYYAALLESIKVLIRCDVYSQQKYEVSDKKYFS